MTANDTVKMFAKTLRNLEKWIEKAEESATARSFEVNVLASSRLAPDAYEFTKQVQAACDQAKFAAAYLSGQPAPSHPDTEKTIDEIKARIATCLAFVDSVPEAAYAGADERKVSPGWLGGAWLRGSDYVAEVAIPNFYFHVTMAYAILRHNGVALGKMDFIGGLTIQQG